MLCTNEDRADWVQSALEAFAEETGQRLPVDKHEIVGDFLADLRHWCERNGVNFSQQNKNGFEHYKIEVLEELEEKCLKKEPRAQRNIQS